MLHPTLMWIGPISWPTEKVDSYDKEPHQFGQLIPVDEFLSHVWYHKIGWNYIYWVLLASLATKSTHCKWVTKLFNTWLLLLLVMARGVNNKWCSRQIRSSKDYLSKFEKIRTGDCERQLIGLTWPNKNWVVQTLIRLSEFSQSSVRIILNSGK
jgi:hypothetical protein